MLISSGLKKSRIKLHKKNRLSSRRKKYFGHFFLIDYPLQQTSTNILLGSTRCFENYGSSYEIISSLPKRLLKTQTFEKALFSVEKNLGQPFLVKSKLTNLTEQIIRVHKVFWYLLCKFYDLFVRTQEFDGKFVRKKSIFLVKSKLACSVS